MNTAARRSRRVTKWGLPPTLQPRVTHMPCGVAVGSVFGLERLDIFRHLATPANVKARGRRMESCNIQTASGRSRAGSTCPSLPSRECPFELGIHWGERFCSQKQAGRQGFCKKICSLPPGCRAGLAPGHLLPGRRSAAETGPGFLDILKVQAYRNSIIPTKLPALFHLGAAVCRQQARGAAVGSSRALWGSPCYGHRSAASRPYGEQAQRRCGRRPAPRIF